MIFLCCLTVAAAAGHAQAKASDKSAVHARRGVGDAVAKVLFHSNCNGFYPVQTGLEYDGKYLWHSCSAPSNGAPDLVASNPKTGATVLKYNIAPLIGNGENGLYALTYDWARNALYAVGSNNCTAIFKLQLNAAHHVVSVKFLFDPSPGLTGPVGCNYALAYDGQTGLLYYADADSQTIHKFKLDGTYLGSFPARLGQCSNYVDGLAIGGDLLFEGSGQCNHVYAVDKNTNALVFDFSTRNGGTGSFRDTDLTCDNLTFKGTDVVWSKEAFAPFAYAFKVPRGTCDIRGTPAAPTVKLTAVEKGDAVVYRLHYLNEGGSTAKQVHIGDPIPAGTSLERLGKRPPCGHWVTADIATFCVGTLDPSQGGQVWLTLKLQPDSMNGVTVRDCATVRYRDLSGHRRSVPESCASLVVNRKA
jgi:uncharacterized repeat protein (TIGR01451 family)